MKLHSTTQRAHCKPALRNNILTGLFPLLAVAGGAAAAPAPAPAAPPCACNVYSVINLDPEGAIAYLNEKGQAAVGSFEFGSASFFDGQRLVPLGSFGSGYTVVKGLNKHGMVVGESLDDSKPFPANLPFTWTVARGMRPVPGALSSLVWGINDHNQIVGNVGAAGVSARAARFEPNGTVTALGPLPFSLSEGLAINNAGVTGGYADHADGTIHASMWDARGRVTDLGTLGGQHAFSRLVNERGEAAGSTDDAGANEIGFFWSPRGGPVLTGARNGGSRLVAGLNDRGEVVGLTAAAGTTIAYYWSRGRGLVPLPRAGAPESDVFDINNRSEMVGGVWCADGWRATLWRGLAAPVDLNGRLHRIPAGLVLERAVAINEAGTILATSNAGLVMLRPGTSGTDAPVLGPLTGLPGSASVGQEARATIGFIDNAPNQAHTATVDWGDSCASPAALVREANGRGEVTLTHRFCAPGFHTVVLRVADSGGRTTEARKQVLVDEPGLAAVSGRGKLAGAGAAGARRSVPLQFTLWAPLGKTGLAGKGAGNTAGKAALVLQGPFGFRSDSVAVTAREGATLRVEGTGRYNGRAGYRFQLDAADGDNARGGRDHMRVRISHRDAAGAEVLDYDSAGAARTGAKVAAALAGAAAPGGMSPVEGVLALSN